MKGDFNILANWIQYQTKVKLLFTNIEGPSSTDITGIIEGLDPESNLLSVRTDQGQRYVNWAQVVEVKVA